MTNDITTASRVTVGMDLGDRYSQICVLDEAGEMVEQGRVPTTDKAVRQRFAAMERCRIAIEAGTHSAWLSRVLAECGHEVLVANPRKLRLIYENDTKDDRVDAEYLARLARVDPDLLKPIRHRGKQAQAHLTLVRSRDVLVTARTQLVNHVRGVVKSVGGRLPKCSTASLPKQALPHLPDDLRSTLEPLLDQVRSLTAQIHDFDGRVEKLATEHYPETVTLRQVCGVGALTALTFVLTIEDPGRFKHSRDVGSYLGLVPRRSESGQSEPQLRITKAGDVLLRRLLVSAAHYVLGPFGEDCDLRRWGLKIAERGGKNAKKRAVVAVARKLAVLLHRLWITGETYESLKHAMPA